MSDTMDVLQPVRCLGCGSEAEVREYNGNYIAKCRKCQRENRYSPKEYQMILELIRKNREKENHYE